MIEAREFLTYAIGIFRFSNVCFLSYVFIDEDP